MTDRLITTLVYDMALLYKKKTSAKSYFDHVGLSGPVQAYLKDVSAEEFVDEAAQMLALSREGTGAPNRLSAVFGEAVVGVITPALDALESSFFLMTSSKRKIMAGKAVQGNGRFLDALRDVLAQHEYHEIVADLIAALDRIGMAYAIVQTAAEPTADQKLDMHETYAKEKTAVFFTVTPDLIGGMRVLKNNELVDMSWQAQLGNILTITT